MSKLVNWIEIPVVDQARAKRFYAAVLNVDFYDMPLGTSKYSIFPSQDGALVAGEGYKPSQTGTLIYLNGGDDLGVPLGRVADAGGKVLLPKTFLSKEAGYAGIFLDTEGNRIGLHSMS
jgi:uncharacterized protein